MRYDDCFADLLGLALRLEGSLEVRIQTLLDYVRVHVLDDCEAVFVSQDRFDFDARRLLLGQPIGAVRADIDPSIYQVLRSSHFLERIDQAYTTWATNIIRENEKSSTFWMCDTVAAAGVDIAQWRDEQLSPAGLEDVWGATAYVGKGSFLTVLLPLHRGSQYPSPEHIEFILKLPPVLAPILMPGDPIAADPTKTPNHATAPTHNGKLSQAQSRVLTLALNGLTEKEIAHRIHRSHHTVNSHLRAIYRRYNVTSRAELMALAIEHQLNDR